MDDCLKLDDDDLFTQSDFEEENEEFCTNLEENPVGLFKIHFFFDNKKFKTIFFYTELNKFPEFNCNDEDSSESIFNKNGFVNNLDVENFATNSEIKQEMLKLFGVPIHKQSLMSKEIVTVFFMKARMNILKIQMSTENGKKLNLEESFHDLRLEVRTFLHILRMTLDFYE